jgi:hypothetical protein
MEWIASAGFLYYMPFMANVLPVVVRLPEFQTKATRFYGCHSRTMV